MVATKNNYQDLFESALAAEGVSGSLAKVARSIYAQESGSGKNTKTSSAGAMGGMQIIPSTFASVADKGWDINNPEQNARAGIRYLQQLDKQSGGNPALTAAGYYGGPGGMEKARRGIAVSDPRNPNAPNTLEYMQQVVRRIGGAAPVVSVLAQPDTAIQQAPPELTAIAAPPPQVVAQAPVPVQPMAQPEAAPVVVAQAPIDEPSWDSFQRAMPQVVMPAAMNYGQAPVPKVQMAGFQRFKPFGARG